jgi:hypothetical protein
MKLRSTSGLAAGLVTLGLLTTGPAVAAGPANVDVRVEGETQTLVPETRVTTTTARVGKDGDPSHTCSGTSGLGALDRATAGNWNGQWFGSSYLVDTIKGEHRYAAYPADPAPYWTFWLNYKASDTGLCEVELQEGDDVLIFADCFGSQCASTPTPLRLTVPRTAAPGSTATVRVEQLSATGYPSVTNAQPAAGATVSSGGQTYTTGADGTATIAVGTGDSQTVQATKPDRVRSAVESLCLTTGTDGLCGSADVEPPHASVLGIQEGQRFSRRKAPRTLRGTVTADPAGLRAVKLRLTRQDRGDCFKYSGKEQRFQSKPCGTRSWFKIGDRADWSYLLPKRLGRGRYVLDVTALDNERNRDALVRGRTRVVFTVR